MLTAADTVGPQLVSRSELAGLAGVSRPTITTWAKRHHDFPRPVPSAEGDLLELAEIVAWLDRRPIPAAARSADEPAGYTYGHRVRRRCARLPGAGTLPDEPAGDDTQQVLDRLLGLASRVRGGFGTQAEYVTLLLCLIFLRRCAVERWSELVRMSRPDTGPTRPASLVHRIGAVTDEALRRYGIVPGVQAALDRLRARSLQDLARVISLCGRLGAYGFGQLLDRFAAESRLSSSDFFTPGEVALLMANLVVRDARPGRPVYDPYFRGGELLRAARLARSALDVGTVRGESPNVETLRFAGMYLALLGQPAELRPGSSTPWEDLRKPRPIAGAVVLNPPFNRRTELAGDVSDDAWPFGTPPPDNANFAWLQYAISCLAPDAGAAVLMPRQAGSTADQRQREIRAEMVRRGAVEAIIMLPSRLFPSSSADVNLWVVRPPTGSPGAILFIDARRMLNRARTGQILAPAAVEEISGIYRSRRDLAVDERVPVPEGGLAIMAGVAAIRGKGYSLNPLDYFGALSSDSSAPYESGLGSLHQLMNQLRDLDQLGSAIRRLEPVARTGISSGLPSGWSRPLMDQLCEVQPGPSYSRLGIQERSQAGSVPVVMPRHLRDRRVIAADADKVTEDAARKLKDFRLAADDILCVRSGTMGDPAIVQESQAGWLFGTNIIRVRIRTAEPVDPGFLLGFLSLPDVLEWIRSQSASTVISSISAESLKQLPVTLPPLGEQRRIGSALLAFDALIAAHREIALTAARTRRTLSARLMEGAVTLR